MAEGFESDEFKNWEYKKEAMRFERGDIAIDITDMGAEYFVTCNTQNPDLYDVIDSFDTEMVEDKQTAFRYAKRIIKELNEYYF
jgi:hypothetical protein